MNAIKNPFSPGAGSPPPEMVGREGILDQARILLGRVKEKRPEKSILLTGLRGVGKTVLLNEIERLAAKVGSRSISAAGLRQCSLLGSAAFCQRPNELPAVARHQTESPLPGPCLIQVQEMNR